MSKGLPYRKFSQRVKFASAGIKHAFWTQRNIRIHLCFALAVLIAGIIMGLAVSEMVALMLTISFVVTSEMINTSIEEVVDLIVKEKRAAANIAKDVAAGAVLLSSFCAIIIGCLIFIPHIFR